MNDTNLLLKAYYEALYERLWAKKEILTKKIEQLLPDEIAKRGYGEFDQEKYAAYMDACLAFVDERLESYNPVGIQFLFDRTRAWEAFELELQLNWYDSRKEFEDLVELAREKVKKDSGIDLESEIRIVG